jgi:AcrR family transcriptional regulator
MTLRPVSQTPHPLRAITSSAQLELRARILIAAKQRFARFSHEDTTLGDIARIAGMAEDMVRQHFEDTYVLLVALQRSLERGKRASRKTSPGGRRSFQKTEATTHRFV